MQRGEEVFAGNRVEKQKSFGKPGHARCDKLGRRETILVIKHDNDVVSGCVDAKWVASAVRADNAKPLKVLSVRDSVVIG